MTLLVPLACACRWSVRASRCWSRRTFVLWQRGPAVIEYRNVVKRYGDTTVVDDFSLVIPNYTTTVLVGSSGSGKTTVLRMVNRMVNASAGHVLIDDEDVASRDAVQLRRSIGYVMQQSGLLPHVRVLDNVATVLRLQGVARDEARERAEEMLHIVGLDASIGSRYPSQLSGGQQQRVGVARALAPDPNILLMDEPFGAVDPLVRAELQRETIRLQRELGKTILFVTHDLEEAFAVGDEIVILDKNARIAQRGTAREIISNPADDFVAEFIGVERDRRLRLLDTPEGRLVVDERGRAKGFLADDDTA